MPTVEANIAQADWVDVNTTSQLSKKSRPMKKVAKVRSTAGDDAMEGILSHDTPVVESTKNPFAKVAETSQEDDVAAVEDDMDLIT